MMQMTSNRQLSKLNWTRALIRIQKELQYILRKSDNRTPKEKAHIRKAIHGVVDAILEEQK